MKIRHSGIEWYRSLDLDNDLELLEFDAKADVAVAVEKILNDKGMSKKNLAAALGKSQPYITKILSGDANLTIGSLVRIARALDRKIEFDFVDPAVKAFSERITDGVQFYPKPNAAADGWAQLMRQGAANNDLVLDVNEQTATA